MRYYKQIENGYIMAIGTGGGGTEITETEYNTIMTVIHNKPQGNEIIDYHLKEDLTWEQYQVEPLIPDNNSPDGLLGTAEYLFKTESIELPNTDEEPDYFNEHEPELAYFN